MKKLLRETKRGISGFLAILLILTSTLTGNVLEARANGNDPQLTVASDFSVTGNGSVYYLPTDGGNINDSGTWIQISGGISEAVDAIAIAFQPEDGWYASSIVFDDETFGDHDGSTFWIGEGTRNLKSVTFTQGEPPVRVPCQLTVASDFSVTGNGSVYYLPAEGGDMDDPETWVRISGGISEAVGVMAIVFQPEDGWYASGIVFSNETFNNHDGSTFWLPTDTTRCLGSVTFSQGTPPDPDPQPCQLTVASYSNTYGKIYYTADLDGDDNWVEVPTNGITSPVSAFRVKGVPVSGNYTVSYTLNNSTNITDDGDHGLFPEIGTNTVTNIVFAERSPGDPGNGGGNTVTPILVAPYTNTHGKMQYSVDDQEWIDIPADGISTNTDAMLIRAVPAPGYSVSYKIDGNVVNEPNPHGFGSNPTPHNITDIIFSLTPKSLNVSSYTDTYGKIQYSTDGTNWNDVSADGETVNASYVKATAANGYSLDSYTLNSQTIYSDTSQTLTQNSNTISNVSFIQNSSSNGKYLLSVDNQLGVNCTATVKFLNSSAEVISTAATGSAADIPDGTAKIRIELSDKRFLKSIQIFRVIAPAEPNAPGGIEIARPAVEEGLWQNGNVEFSASKAYSYNIIIELSNTKNVGWSYKDEDKGTDKYVENCKLYLLDDQGNRRPYIDESDDNKATTDYASYNLTIDQTYKFELVPDYGYQIKALSINGYEVLPTDDTGVFSFTMKNTNFHFKGVVMSASDIVSAPNAYSGATISGGSNAVSSGNVKMTITNTATDNSAAAVAGEGATAVATVDIDLAKVISKGNGQYWSENITEASGNVTLGIPVSKSGLSNGETYSVVREHNGIKTELNATYNADTEMLTFASSLFSDYTIVKKSGTPATDSASAAKEETKQESSESSSGNDDNDDSSSGSTANVVASTLGSIVDKTATGGLASKTVIKDWNDLNNVLIKDNTGSAASKNVKKKVLTDRQKAKGELVQIVLNKKDATIPDSTFDALYNSNKSGLHIFVANGTALTFINNRQLRNQKALDLTCTVTAANGSKIISFKTYAKLKAKTMLHTTVPAGVKTVTVYKYDAKGNRKYFGKLKPTAEGRVCFGVTELTKYELVYNY